MMISKGAQWDEKFYATETGKKYKTLGQSWISKKPEAEIVLYFQHSILGMSAKQAKNVLEY